MQFPSKKETFVISDELKQMYYQIYGYELSDSEENIMTLLEVRLHYYGLYPYENKTYSYIFNTVLGKRKELLENYNYPYEFYSQNFTRRNELEGELPQLPFEFFIEMFEYTMEVLNLHPPIYYSIYNEPVSKSLLWEQFIEKYIALNLHPGQDYSNFGNPYKDSDVMVPVGKES